MYSSGGCFIQGDFVLYTLLHDNMLNVIIWHLFNLSFPTSVQKKKKHTELNVTILSSPKENKSGDAALHIPWHLSTNRWDVI